MEVTITNQPDTRPDWHVIEDAYTTPEWWLLDACRLAAKDRASPELLAALKQLADVIRDDEGGKINAEGPESYRRTQNALVEIERIMQPE